MRCCLQVLLLGLVALSGVALAILPRERGGLPDLNRGVRHLGSSLGFLDAFVGNLTAQVEGLASGSSGLVVVVGDAQVLCGGNGAAAPVLTSASGLAAGLLANAEVLSASLGDFLPRLDSLRAQLTAYGIGYRNDALWALGGRGGAGRRRARGGERGLPPLRPPEWGGGTALGGFWPRPPSRGARCCSWRPRRARRLSSGPCSPRGTFARPRRWAPCTWPLPARRT
jgi:hypothetical protein